MQNISNFKINQTEKGTYYVLIPEFSLPESGCYICTIKNFEVVRDVTTQNGISDVLNLFAELDNGDSFEFRVFYSNAPWSQFITLMKLAGCVPNKKFKLKKLINFRVGVELKNTEKYIKVVNFFNSDDFENDQYDEDDNYSVNYDDYDD